ncbi:hypothetical protein [Shewanella mangrovisoli]|uniref:Uncharacterized protein n=1 Tax=Shewanella mangrovisoli TaxID=2864211 RepID=A0ABV4VHY9_9GAMM
MSYADEVAVKAPFDYADEVTVKAESNQLSDKFEVYFEPASINDASPMVVPKNRYRNWPALNQAIGVVGDSGANIPHTPEEDAEFERLERNQQLSEFARIERNQDIALLANVIRTSPTTSAEAIAARVLDAGYLFSGSAVRLK